MSSRQTQNLGAGSMTKQWITGLCAAVVIPVSSPEGWTELQFRKIPANTVSHSAEGVQVTVKNSASPLIYKLPTPAVVTAVEVELQIQGELKFPGGANDFQEDSYFRLGLVAEGDKKLSRVQKMFAPAWVEKLYSLAPEGVGLDKIYFLNVAGGEAKIGAARLHPKSELMSEQIVKIRKTGENRIVFSHSLQPPQKVAALWISIDGDDTKSEFKTVIQKLVLQTNAP